MHIVRETCICCLLSLMLMVQSVQPWYYAGGEDRYDDDDEAKLMNFLNDVKRTDWSSRLCGEWDDFCTPNSKRPITSCCSGYTCKCNLWQSNCRCKAKLFGR